MKKSQINIFNKGIATDIDYMFRDTSQWDFPTMNYRIVNKEGQGLILTTLPSNTREIDDDHTEGEEFKITDNYICIGACDYKGIMYIVSCDGTNSEIGMFPSYNIDTGNLESKYSVLRNYTTDVENKFRTSLFNYSLYNMCEVLAKDSYDTSVDLYICDGVNPNRVVNTGVKEDGTYTDRTYTRDDFYSTLNQIPATGQDIKTELDSITPDGELEYGNMYFYFRYLTEGFDKTTFVGQCGVCQIFDGEDRNRYVQGGSPIYKSNKSVNIILSDLDTTYKYIQVAFVRFTSDNSEIPIKQTGLYDKYYVIPEEGDMSIKITGRETVIPFTEAEIITPKILERTCKTQTQQDNRYWGGNWKSPDKNSKLLAELVSKIEAKWFTESIQDGSININAEVINKEIDIPDMQYKNYYLTYDKVGYFRGEMYMFVGGFKFKDGSESNVFPVKGHDFVLDAVTTDVDGNETGVVRFPFHNQLQASHYIGDKLKIMGIGFVTDELLTAINALGSTDKEWFVNNVESIFFARAKRRKWLQYQGLAIMGSSGTKLNQHYEKNLTVHTSVLQTSFHYPAFKINQKYPDDYMDNTYKELLPRKYYKKPSHHTLWGLTTDNEFSDDEGKSWSAGHGYMPLMMHYLPMMSVKGKNVVEDGDNVKRWGYYAARSFPFIERYGVFSPDFMFNVSSEDLSQYKYIKKIAKTRGNASYKGNINGWQLDNDEMKWSYSHNDSLAMYPRFAVFDMKSLVGSNYKNNIWLESNYTFDVDNINISQSNNKHGMANKSSDFSTGSSDIFAMVKSSNGNRVNSNRNMYIKKYIGLNMEDENRSYRTWTGVDYVNQDVNLDLDIVNIYDRPDTFDVEKWYDSPGSRLYYQIGQSKSFSYDIDIDNISLDDTEYVAEDPITFEVLRGYRFFYGDCFLQRTYFKQMTWDASKFSNDGKELGFWYSDSQDGVPSGTPIYSNLQNTNNYETSGQPSTYYRHGVIIGVVTENNINTAMRFTTDDHDYFPHTTYGWAYMPLDGKGIESMRLNRGHCETLGIKVHNYWFAEAPVEINIKPTRIRYSAKHTPYSFVDSYRLFDIAGYKDYELSNGPIYSLKSYLGSIVSVQESSINLHNFGREEVTAPTNIGDIVLGTSNYLSPYVQKLINYGTQHQFSIIATDNGIYGVDLNRRTIWGIGASQDSKGQRSMNAYSLSASKLISKWIDEVAEYIGSDRSDIMNTIYDYPALYNGVVAGYDKYYDEVIFSFLYNTYELIEATTKHYKYSTYTKKYIKMNSTPFNPERRFYVNNYLYYDSTYYIVIEDFTVGTTTTFEDIEDKVILVSDVNPKAYYPNKRYYKDFVIIPSALLTHSKYDNVETQVSGCGTGNGYALIYVTTEKSGYEILNGEFDYILSFCATQTNAGRTLVYSEYIQNFIGEYSYYSHIYPSIKDDFYSFKPTATQSYAYLHNRKDDDLFIYNEQAESVISFIVNGASQEGGTTVLEKVFDNIHIHTNNINFSSIIFETENHIGTKDPFNSIGTEFWSDPEWIENKFYMPVQCQTKDTDNEFIEDSQLRGTWMKITIKYAGRIRKFIKSIITEFTTSEG